MRGSREISLVPSLHRVSTDALIILWCIDSEFLLQGMEFDAWMINIDGNQIKLQIWDTVS